MIPRNTWQSTRPQLCAVRHCSSTRLVGHSGSMVWAVAAKDHRLAGAVELADARWHRLLRFPSPATTCRTLSLRLSKSAWWHATGSV
jgi:hypothetical protein